MAIGVELLAQRFNLFQTELGQHCQDIFMNELHPVAKALELIFGVRRYMIQDPLEIIDDGDKRVEQLFVAILQIFSVLPRDTLFEIFKLRHHAKELIVVSLGFGLSRFEFIGQGLRILLIFGSTRTLNLIPGDLIFYFLFYPLFESFLTVMITLLLCIQ